MGLCTSSGIRMDRGQLSARQIVFNGCFESTVASSAFLSSKTLEIW